MSLPSYPTPTDPTFNAPQPGLYPLRPLAVGEVLTAALRVAVRHLAVLAPIAFVVAVLNVAVSLSVLSMTGYLHSYASGDYARTTSNPTPAELNAMLGQVGHIFVGLGSGLVVSLMCAPVLAAVATPFAAQAATTKTGSNAAGLARLKGRWGTMAAVGCCVGVALSLGFALLLVPGIMLWLILMPAGPVAAMEGSSIGDTLRRAMRLSSGFKARLFGVTMLATLFVLIAGFVISSILGGLIKSSDDVTRLLLTQGLAALASAFTGAWLACVTAMLYIDIRMRREGLANALIATAR